MYKRIGLVGLWAIVFVACSKQELNIDQATCTTYITDKQQAQQVIVGRWHLTKLIVSIPNPPVPDLDLLIDPDGHITVQENGQLTAQVSYQIEAAPYNTLLLKTDAQPRPDNWFFRNPAVRLCQGQLLLDAGIAQDLPGYEFHRVINR